MSEIPRLETRDGDLKTFDTSDGRKFCLYSQSENKEYTVIWHNTRVEDSKVRLFKDNIEIAKVKCQNPSFCRVANNGNFIICDDLDKTKLESTLTINSKTGKRLFNKKFQAFIHSGDISPSGKYAITFNANNPESNHGNLLFLYDIEENINLWKIHPPFWPKSYRFDEENKLIQLFYDYQLSVYESIILRLIKIA